MRIQICGSILPDNDKRIGGPRTVCTKEKGHNGEHGQWARMLQIDHAEAMTTGIELSKIDRDSDD